MQKVLAKGIFSDAKEEKSKPRSGIDEVSDSQRPWSQEEGATMTPRAEEVSPGGSNSPLEAPVGRAHRACEKCTRTKKKCDKGIPSCSRCARCVASP